jgi:membrane-associated phospholipid phosphatase
VTATALAGWAFGAITQDVLARDEAALRDPRLATWTAGHRAGWLTATANAAVWLGSAIVIAVLVAILAAGRKWRAADMLALALGGSLALDAIVQHLVGRSRPPTALAIGDYAGSAFPSGATTAIAWYGILAFILAAGASPRIRALLWAAAVTVTILAGASQVYPGANWLDDVLGGWALGALWIAIILTAELLNTGPRSRAASTRPPHSSLPSTRRRQVGRSTAGA